MSEMRLVDTNLIIRHLVQDDEELAGTAQRLFDASDRGELTLLILPAVLAECVYVLLSFYKKPRPDIARVLKDLVTGPGIAMDDLPMHLDALSRFAASKAHFVDCVIAAGAANFGVAVATFDNGFKTFTDVRVNLRVGARAD